METPTEYIRSILDVNISKLHKSSDITRELMKALAMNVAQTPTYETLVKDMAYGDVDRSPSIPTIKAYLEELKRLYLVTNLEG